MPSQSQLYLSPPRWRQDSGARRNAHPAILSWLLEQGSLTRRLKSLCGHSFKVKLMDQRWGRPLHDESRRLGLRNGQRAIIREVALCSEKTPLILARSVIPARTLKGVDRRLGKLGTRPLGQILFSHPQLKRVSMEFSTLAIPGRQPLWGRRSLYSLGHQHTLLVAEFFTPELFTLFPTQTG